MRVDVNEFVPLTVQVHNIAVNKELGRISIDGIVNGRYTARVIESSDIPKSIKTQDQYSRYLEKQLSESIEDQGEPTDSEIEGGT